MASPKISPKTPKTPKTRRVVDLSAFGRYLQKNEVSREDAAKQFGITPAYVSMLSHGAATPGLALALAILRWSRKKFGVDGEFGVETWGV